MTQKEDSNRFTLEMVARRLQKADRQWGRGRAAAGGQGWAVVAELRCGEAGKGGEVVRGQLGVTC